ncbi:hypothetical protein E3N88_14456 [Mikania micrantha]|uniref:Phytocyanin domain-containing protein n=1 Tax=Mikania micrantha TaxID=192012 RepID=A0A5N6P433_9ASTR|nr:hypothetical protein E3N88_14456 [Mikania micrantha]
MFGGRWRWILRCVFGGFCLRVLVGSGSGGKRRRIWELAVAGEGDSGGDGGGGDWEAEDGEVVAMVGSNHGFWIESREVISSGNTFFKCQQPITHNIR